MRLFSWIDRLKKSIKHNYPTTPQRNLDIFHVLKSLFYLIDPT